MTLPLRERLRPIGAAMTPGSHLGLTWRKLSKRDKSGMLRLIQEAEDYDDTVQKTLESDLNRFWDHSEPGIRDIVVGLDRSGIIQAAGLVELPNNFGSTAEAWVNAIIAPKWRGRGVGRALISWQDARARQMIIESNDADTKIPVRIASVVDAHSTDRRRLYGAAGFSVKRSFSVLNLVMPPVSEIPELRSGYKLVPWPGPNGKSVIETYGFDTLADWVEEQSTLYWWNKVAEGFESAWSFVALKPDNEVIGFIFAGRNQIPVASPDIPEAYVYLVNKVSSPIDSALIDDLLATCLGALEKSGVKSLSLDTATQNLAQFDDLQARWGFTEIGKKILYTIEV